LNLRQSELNNEFLRQSVYKSIRQASSDATAAYNKFDAGEKSVAAQQQALNYNQQRYDLGLISTYDYLIAKNNLARAKAELLQARYDFIFRIKVLDFYMGKPLAF
jgi:outer membrane protein